MNRLSRFHLIVLCIGLIGIAGAINFVVSAPVQKTVLAELFTANW
ncbi:MAG: hypothetical protein N3A72_03445 [bacterium]|nr:hypothetical protein [bacterium]